MSDRHVVIRANQLGKCFHIYNKPQDRLKQFFSLNQKKYYREFWALQDVSFSVHKGGSFGIIGRNGSGKSTLLQMLCQTLTPTAGNVEVNGRIAALLELGAGFNPEFTGKENVYMNGAILGFSRKEMDARFDEIIAFADIGDFIDQPVKTYSSGMFVRLAFSVQAHVSPDILIIDEALSVGDIFFQQKCAKRMQYLREQGTTLIFVSHDMGTVRDLCENAVYLKSGKMIYCGPSIEAIRKYYAESGASDVIVEKKQESHASQDVQSTSSIHFQQQFKDQACWIAPSIPTPHEKDAVLLAVAVVDASNLPTMKAQMGAKIKLRVLYQSFTENPTHVTVAFRNRYDHTVNSSGTYTRNIIPPVLKRGDIAVFELQIDCMLEAGAYTFRVFLASEIGLPNRGKTLDESPWLGPLSITWDYENERAPWLGMFGLPVDVSITELSE